MHVIVQRAAGHHVLQNCHGLLIEKHVGQSLESRALWNPRRLFHEQSLHRVMLWPH
jgi:hypothetical protein